jgi:hypothetical protein
MDTYIVDSSMCIKHIINLVWHQVKITQRLNIEDSMKPIRRTQGMNFGFNRGVRSVSADRSVTWSGTEVARFDDMFRD